MPRVRAAIDACGVNSGHLCVDGVPPPMPKKKPRPATKAHSRNRQPWTLDVVITEMPPADVEGFLESYVRLVIGQARGAETALASQPLQRVA